MPKCGVQGMRNLVVTLMLWAGTAHAADLGYPTTCVGKTSAKFNAIFLRGITPPDINYENDLKAMAEALNLRIAIPRSTTNCKGSTSKFCWYGEEPADIEATYAAVLRSAVQCFPQGARFGLIGFSNGGYHAGKVVLRCLAPQPAWVVAMGSAGDIGNAVSSDLSRCAPTTLLIGEKDITRDKARNFAAQLRVKKLDVEFKTWKGGHDVPFPELRQIVARRLR